MSNDEFTKLSTQIRVGFSKVDAKLSSHDKSFENFYKYTEKRFDAIDKQFEQNKKEHSNIMGSIAELSAEVKDYHVELILISKKVDRLAEAVRQIASETGVKLKFDF